MARITTSTRIASHALGIRDRCVQCHDQDVSHQRTATWGSYDTRYVHTRNLRRPCRKHPMVKARLQGPECIRRREYGYDCTRYRGNEVSRLSEPNRRSSPFEISLSAGAVLLDCRRRLVELTDIAIVCPLSPVVESLHHNESACFFSFLRSTVLGHRTSIALRGPHSDSIAQSHHAKDRRG